MEKKEARIDVDSAIEHYNHNNPESPPLNKVKLAEILGTKSQNLTNYNRGKIPQAHNVLFNMSLFTGYPINKLLIPVNNYTIVTIKNKGDIAYEVWGDFPEKSKVATFSNESKALKFIKENK